MHLRVRTTTSGMTFSDDVWMHVGAAGFVDKVRELRLDGRYAGLESVSRPAERARRLHRRGRPQARERERSDQHPSGRQLQQVRPSAA